MDRKTFSATVKKAADGVALVVLATLNVKDTDGDVTLPGFFGKQTAQAVGAHDWGSVPIGKSTVYEQGAEALAELRFNLATIGGKDWYEAIKFDFENPPAKQEYSYGFTINTGGSRVGKFDDETDVRFLCPLADGSPGCIVHEVSPVLLGAGIDTRTLDVKNRNRTYAEEIADARAALSSLEKRTLEIGAIRTEKGLAFNPERLAELKSLHVELSRFSTSLAPLLEEPAPIDAAALVAEFERVRFQLARL